MTTSCGPVPELFVRTLDDSVQVPGLPPVVAVVEPVVAEPVVAEPVVTEPVVAGPVVTEPVVVAPPVLPPVVLAPALELLMPPNGPPVVVELPLVCDVAAPVVVPPDVTGPPLVVVPPPVVGPEAPSPLVGPTSDVALSSSPLEPSSEQPKPPTARAKILANKVLPGKCAVLIDRIPSRAPTQASCVALQSAGTRSSGPTKRRAAPEPNRTVENCRG